MNTSRATSAREVCQTPRVMVDVIEAAYKMSRYAALKYLLFSGTDPDALREPAMHWLKENITLKPDIDPELFDRHTAERVTVPLTGQV